MRSERALVVATALAFALLGGVAWSAWRQSATSDTLEDRATHTMDVRTHVTLLLSELQQIESAARGYVITGDPNRLEPYTTAVNAVDDEFRLVCTLTSDDLAQQARCAELEPLISTRLAISQRNIDLRQTSGLDAALEAVTAGDGEAVMTLIRAIIAQMDADEELLFRQRSAASLDADRNARFFTIFGIALSACLLGAGFTTVLRENRLRRRTEETLRALNNNLEDRVQVRTAELARAQRAAAEDADRLQTIIDGVTDHAIITLDPSGHVTSWNPGAERLHGYHAQEILGQHFSRFYPADGVVRGEPTVQLEQARITGRYNLEGWRLRKDGTQFWADTTISTLHEGVGQVSGFVTITRDMSERRRAEEEIGALNATLERSVKERTAQLAQFKHALDEHSLVSITDARGTIIYVNNRFCELSQYASEELLGRDHRILNSGYHPKAFMRHLWETIRSGRPWKGEIRNRAKDGTFYWVNSTIVPFLDEGGQPFQYISIRTDMTQRKLAEERVAQLNADLHAGAAKLSEANKELESFAYSVSHDLRAPLRHVQGYVDMLQRATADQLSEKAGRYLTNIRAASVEMGQLIDDLLAFSRMARAEMQSVQVDLDTLVQDTIRGLDTVTAERHIEWQVAPLPTVVGDAALLKQVLVNLLDNAVKYSRERDPARIEIGSVGEPDGRVVLFVRDNGAGFDMQYAHKLFGVFQRLHRAEEFEGTGIGLATVHRVVTRHGGRIWADSAPGKGATFYFTLQPSPSDQPG